ncbi:hypothetical protein CR513_02963, partial [Mucuna pruriens]
MRAMKPIPIRKVFAMSGAVAFRSKNLVLGEYITTGELLVVLYDLGATHSFISYDCAHKLSLPTYLLSFDLLVSTPTATPVVSFSIKFDLFPLVQPRCHLKNELVVFQAYHQRLMQLQIHLITKISKMEIGFQDHVINYARNTLTFSNPKDIEFISANQAKDVLDDGAQWYVILSFLRVKGASKLDFVEVVKDFHKVFLEEVFDLPLLREVEFSIYLISEVGFVSIAPCMMTPTELTELKK